MALPQSQTPCALPPSQSLESETGPVRESSFPAPPPMTAPLQQPVSCHQHLTVRSPFYAAASGFLEGTSDHSILLLKPLLHPLASENPQTPQYGYEIWQDPVPRSLLQPSPPHPLATSTPTKFLFQSFEMTCLGVSLAPVTMHSSLPSV